MKGPDISTLTVGQTLVKRHQSGWRDAWTPVKVTRILKKYFETSDGCSWNDGGYPRGARGYNAPNVYLPDATTIAAVQESKLQDRADYLARFEWHKADAALIQDVYVLVQRSGKDGGK